MSQLNNLEDIGQGQRSLYATLSHVGEDRGDGGPGVRGAGVRGLLTKNEGGWEKFWILGGVPE